MLTWPVLTWPVLTWPVLTWPVLTWPVLTWPVPAADGAIIAPPSTTSVCPVIQDAAPLARKTAALAMSAVSPRRRSGMRRACSCSRPSHRPRAMSVLTRPGAIAFTRTPGAIS